MKGFPNKAGNNIGNNVGHFNSTGNDVGNNAENNDVIAAEDELRVLAINDLGESIDASPACVDDVIYIRGQNHLYCIKDLE